MNASALNTNRILPNATSRRFPRGLGSDGVLLGKYVCHHDYRVNVRNVGKQETDVVGGVYKDAQAQPGVCGELT